MGRSLGFPFCFTCIRGTIPGAVAGALAVQEAVVGAAREAVNSHLLHLRVARSFSIRMMRVACPHCAKLRPPQPGLPAQGANRWAPATECYDTRDAPIPMLPS